nr:aminopeptidase [Candidatus Njordarchaeum guaymaensis]
MRIVNIVNVVTEACNNILRIITHGDKTHTLKKENDLLIIGDSRDHSPLYTEILAKTIRQWQGNLGGKVEARYLPEQRPFTDIAQVDPSIPELAAKADVIIVTYSNPGEKIRHEESPTVNKAFLKTVLDRIQRKSIRLYVVAARPTVHVLESLADTRAIEQTNTLSKQLKRYLQQKAGSKMEIYTLKEGRHGDRLAFTIPSREMVAADYFEANEPIINIPAGEVFFEPTLGTASGKLYLKEGSYYHLNVPIKGMIIMNFENGEIVECRNLGGKDEEVYGFIKKHQQVKENRHTAEMGIGTYLAGSSIPMEEMIYNNTILEKLQGFHIAYGNSIPIKGKHEAPEHIDTWVKYGDVFIGEDHLISGGKINTKLIRRQSRQELNSP